MNYRLLCLLSVLFLQTHNLFAGGSIGKIEHSVRLNHDCQNLELLKYEMNSNHLILDILNFGLKKMNLDELGEKLDCIIDFNVYRVEHSKVKLVLDHQFFYLRSNIDDSYIWIVSRLKDETNKVNLFGYSENFNGIIDAIKRIEPDDFGSNWSTCGREKLAYSINNMMSLITPATLNADSILFVSGILPIRIHVLSEKCDQKDAVQL